MTLINFRSPADRVDDLPPDRPAETPRFDLNALIALIRRRARPMILGVIAGALIGLAYLLTTPKSYTAETELLIDSKRVQTSTSALDTAGLADLALDTGAVDSQVEILHSRKVAEAVIAAFAGREAETFTDRTSLTAQIRSWLRPGAWIGGGETMSAEKAAQRQRDGWVDYLGDNLAIKRVGRTYVLGISFTATDPERAAAIANAFARAYLDDQLDANYEITRRTSDWMQTRLAELRQKSLETDRAVQQFRGAKNLLSTNKEGTLVNQQQLGEISSQLVEARGATAQAQAKYDRLRAIRDSGDMDAAVSESLGSAVITELRNKYLVAAKNAAQLSARLGNEHESVRRLNGEMEEYRRQIFAELGRIAESAKSEVDIATARQKSLEAALDGQAGLSATANQDMVTLRELEREADSYKNLYQTMLERYQETLQKQSFPMSEARVLTVASAPNGASAPRSLVVLALALAIGGVIGAAFAAFRELTDRGFRTSAQVTEALGLEFLGMLPAVGERRLAKLGPAAPESGLKTPAMMRYAVSAPLSGFAETLRAAKVAADIALGDKRPKVIGLVSVLPDEGKSTIAKNFASLLCHLGLRTLLIDGDLRNPGLTRDIVAAPAGGLLEVLTQGAPYTDYLIGEPETGLHILPASTGQRLTHTSELLASRAMARFLAQVGADYDYIIFDLPPLGPVVDVRAAAKYFDGFVFVVEWGRTARDVVSTTLRRDVAIYQKTLGVILNKVDAKALALYESHGSKDYYYSQYKAYYRDRP